MDEYIIPWICRKCSFRCKPDSEAVLLTLKRGDCHSFNPLEDGLLW